MNDAAAVHSVLLSARNDIPLAANFADKAHQDWVRGECRSQHVWVDEREGRIAGVMVMRVTEIFYLVTAPDFRSLGVGAGLINHAVANISRRYSSGVTVRVREANIPIVALLEKLGFLPHPILTTQAGWVVYAVGNVR